MEEQKWNNMEGNSIKILSYQNGTDRIKWRETPYKMSAYQYRMEEYSMGQIRKLCISYTEGTYIVILEKIGSLCNSKQISYKSCISMV